MRARVKMSDGIELEIDERDEMETLAKAIVLGNPPKKCDECGNTEGLHYTGNKDAEGNVYVNFKCAKCGARAKLGRYKSGGFFWRRFERYVPSKEGEGRG